MSHDELMDNTYYQLPPELWVKIVDFSGEMALLFTDKYFFSLYNLVNVKISGKIDIISYIMKNNYFDVLKYLVFLKNQKYSIFDKKLLIQNH